MGTSKRPPKMPTRRPPMVPRAASISTTAMSATDVTQHLATPESGTLAPNERLIARKEAIEMLARCQRGAGDIRQLATAIRMLLGV